MEKIYLYFKDASVKNVKKAILQGELSFCEDKKQENKIKNRINQIVEDTFNDDNFKFTFCLTKEEALSPNVIQDIQKVIDNLTKTRGQKTKKTARNREKGFFEGWKRRGSRGKNRGEDL